MKLIEIYTDGACSGNPGRGGWGAVLLCQPHIKNISGFKEQTTNNQMELMAIIEALKTIKKPMPITIYADSKYICEGGFWIGKKMVGKILKNKRLKMWI